MRNVWDVMKSIKNRKALTLHDAGVIVRESIYGETYELTDTGIKEYFTNDGEIEFVLTGMKEQENAYHVVLRVVNKKTNDVTIGCAVEYKTGISPEKVFFRAVKRALSKALRTFITPELETNLIDKYLREGKYVRVPKETEKVRVFRKKPELVVSNQAG